MDCWMRPISTRSIPVPMTMMSMRLHELFLSCPDGQSFESHGGVCLQLPAHCVARVQGGQYVSKQVKSVPLPNSRYVLRFFSDRTVVSMTIPERESGQLMSVPEWSASQLSYRRRSGEHNDCSGEERTRPASKH